MARDFDTVGATAVAIAAGVRERRISAVEVLDHFWARIGDGNPRLNAFVHLDPAEARAAAAAIDRRIAAGEDVGPLAGVPFGIKDNEDCRLMPTSSGTGLYPPVVATQDSPHVARLRAAGAVPVGKTATAEFGLDGVTSTVAFGTTRNPWNLERTPSGSSGGSSAAVAGGLVPFATGSDGGGSIRVPAAFTGLVGLKSTHGRIGRPSGMSDMSCAGALTLTVRDAARHLDVAAGPSPNDRMSLPRPAINYERAIDLLDVAGCKTVWSPDLGFAPVDPEIAQIVQAAARDFMRAAKLVQVERSIALTNTYPDWARFAAHRLEARLRQDGLWPVAPDAISGGPRDLLQRFADTTLEDLEASQRRLTRLAREVGELFDDIDLLLCPTAATEPYRAEGPMPIEVAGRDARDTNAEPFTIFANVAWLPSISVPAGVTRAGLPVGLLVTGRRHCDEVLLRAAHLYEQAHPWALGAPIL
ncbi:amidase [Roseiterribacter gracilis]|uniref:Amidase n=1 Tax=Roseiterribacter gracilis TaxID=2812848 RepID=A0A8S8XC39_9PROT|nr:amidase [Rhodospirillales bacterium TMPK1]